MIENGFRISSIFKGFIFAIPYKTFYKFFRDSIVNNTIKDVAPLEDADDEDEFDDEEEEPTDDDIAIEAVDESEFYGEGADF